MTMEKNVSLNAIYKRSRDVVARTIHGEIIIIPISQKVQAEHKDALFTLNETGKAVWEKLDGKKTIGDIINSLLSEFEGSKAEIQEDVIGLIEELFKRKMIIKN